MHAPDAVTAFLRTCAGVDSDPATVSRVVEAAARVADWSSLPARADAHGLAPLVRHFVRLGAIALPPQVVAQLGVMAIRQRDLGACQVEALGEILQAFRTAGINLIVLKGAVLAHDVYPHPDLRPMRDLDVLVARADSARAIAVLEGLRFRPAGAPTPWAHHHLPAVARMDGDYMVTVEVHEDAMTFDRCDRVSMDTLTAPPRLVPMGAERLPALGHHDMLRHLAAALLEHRDEMRLINTADVIGYAATHAAAIDWERLTVEHAWVVNAVSLLHFVRPLPAALAFLAPPSDTAPPRGVGIGLPHLHRLASRAGPAAASAGLRALLYPSDWWMHMYYGVPAGRPLTATRWRRHMPTVARWVMRRLGPQEPRA